MLRIFSQMDNKIRYNDFGCFLAKHFPFKVQKISVNAGFTCPNRDGSKGYGGCTYCNNQTFNPEYCRTEKSVRQQLEEGKEFFSRKYPEMKYLAYFQAYTNTYAELEKLKAMYEEALSVDGVVGLGWSSGTGYRYTSGLYAGFSIGLSGRDKRQDFPFG